MYYVAYGSNMNLEQMTFRCPNSIKVGTGYIKDYNLVFNYHANIVYDEGCMTPAVIFHIADDDWKNLDRYEGYPYYYEKKIVEVYMGGDICQCIAYVMTEMKGKGREYCPPNAEYYQCIYDGYEMNGLEAEFNTLKTALHYSYIKETQTID